MRKAKLIGEETTWQQLNYSRCGRTDKGVSAAGQVMHTFRLFDCRLCLCLLCCSSQEAVIIGVCALIKRTCRGSTVGHGGSCSCVYWESVATSQKLHAAINMPQDLLWYRIALE